MKTLIFIACILLSSFSLSALAQSDSTKSIGINLRGSNENSSEPLVIIDGNKQYVRGSIALKHINPENIESIHIFKGEEGIEKYGSEAINGVISVKTKTGKLSPFSTKGNVSLFFNGINKATKTPLYVYDGKIVDEFSIKFIKQETIESINVLKSEQAKSLYGTRGVNGVIIINSKIKP